VLYRCPRLETDQSCGEEEEAGAPKHMNLSELTASAAHGTARYSALCEDFEEAPKFHGPPPPLTLIASPPTANSDKSVKTIPECCSDLLDDNGTVTIACMLGARRKLQSRTSTHSERTVELDSKFTLRKVTDDAGKVPKMTNQEASQRVRIAHLVQDYLKRRKSITKSSGRPHLRHCGMCWRCRVRQFVLSRV